MENKRNSYNSLKMLL